MRLTRRMTDEIIWAAAVLAAACLMPSVIYWAFYWLYRLYQALGVME